jgi:hypothetical protein
MVPSDVDARGLTYEGRSLEVIRSARLDLFVFSPSLMNAIIAGDRETARRLSGARLPDDLFPTAAADVEFFCMRRDQVERDASWAPWSLRGIVLRQENVAIGTTNFHGPPGVNDTETPGAAEVGYEISPPTATRVSLPRLR